MSDGDDGHSGGLRMTDFDALMHRQRDHRRPLHHPLVDQHRRVLADNELERHPVRRLMTPLPVSNSVTTRALTSQGWSTSLVQASTSSDAKMALPPLPVTLTAKHIR